MTVREIYTLQHHYQEEKQLGQEEYCWEYRLLHLDVPEDE